MSFKPRYDTRNRENLNKLADNTKIVAYKWYQYCINKEYDVLIYETIRSLETQKENVKKGASKTLKSYHIVGQALDFVFVDSKGNALWSINAYISKIDAINYAKSLGFTWGGDWDNDGDWRDETFLDSPHIQYNYKGYGTDTFGKIKDVIPQHITTSQKEERKIKLLKDSIASSLRNEFIADLEKAYENKVFSDKKWIELAKSGELTLADAFLLKHKMDKKK